MVVVDVAGFQAMWLASRCSDLYMKRARRCFKCTNQLLEKCWRQLFEVQEGVLYGATSLKCPTHPGAETSLRLLQRDRRKWGKRSGVHTLQCPCAHRTYTVLWYVALLSRNNNVISVCGCIWHLWSDLFSLQSWQVNDEQVDQEWFLT